MAAEWPLTGRSDELQWLGALLRAGDVAGVVVSGPAGVGKTRLAAEGLRLAEAFGHPVASVTATRAASTLPFGALAPMLPDLQDANAGLVDNRADLLRRSAAALVERAGGKRLVFLVDDAHLLDDASATLVHQLATTRAALIVATVRADEPAPEPIVALWKEDLGERIDLGGLTLAAVQTLLPAILAGPVDDATVAHLHARSEGNVLFLRELVNGALEDGSLRDDGGLWRLVRALSPSQRLAELVEMRLGRLEPAERDLLELVSFGEPLGLAELEALADPDLVERLVRSRLLLSSMSRRRVEVRLSHPVYGDVLRRRTAPIRVRRIARSLADAVEATGARRREDTLRIATWALEGGISRPGIMLAAARTARWRFDFALAERLVAGAVDGGAGFGAHLLAAQIAILQGRLGEADALLAKLVEQAQTDAERAAVAVSRIDALAVYLGRMTEGMEMAMQAEARIADPTWRAEVTARRAVVAFALDGPRASAELSLPLLSQTTGRAFVWASMSAAFSLPRLGRIAEAFGVLDRGYAAHVGLQDGIDRYPWIHLWLRCEALAHAGRLDESEALALAQHREGVDVGSLEAQAYFAWHLATVVGDRGHVVAAIRHAREGIALNRELGRPHYVGECLIGLATALALAGSPRDAAKALAAFDELELIPATSMFKPIELTLARGWAAVAAGDLVPGGALFEQAAEQARSRGDLVGEAAAWHCLARIGFLDPASARLVELAGEADGGLVSARAAHAAALAARDHVALAAVAETFEAMGADLPAAEAAAAAAGTARAAGDLRRATAYELTATRLVERCEGAVTPGLTAVATRARLTPQERRSALLAAAGRTNKQVADELFLSVRTIENHLQRVYEKLGIRSRSDLAGALGGDVPTAPE
ncbi:MAG: LuxR C-terminal-related transcriptional regulator [Sporichthyaceae bacterium]